MEKSIICKTDNFAPLVVPGLSVNSGSSSSPTSLPQESLRPEADQASGNRVASSSSSGSVFERSDEHAARRLGQKSLRDDKKDADDPLEDFTDNLEDTEVPAPAHISQDSVSEHPPIVVTKLRKHSIYTHFPKDRNCGVCLRTKITKASCRRRVCTVVPRAEILGDLITADHEVLSDRSESRNNHRYAVLVQDLATQWMQSYRCKTKTSQKTQRSLEKFLEPTRKPKVIYTDNSLELDKSCEELSWNSCASAPHRSETNVIAGRAVRRVKESTSAVLLQSGLNENWQADSLECYTSLRNIQALLSDGKSPYERRFGQPFKGPIIPFGSLVEYHPKTAKDQSRIHQFGKKILLGLFLGYALYAGEFGRVDVLIADLEELETMDASEIYSKRLNAKEVIFHKENGKFIFPVADGRIKFVGEDQELRTLTLIRDHPIRGEGQRLATNGIAERAARRVKEGTSAVLMQSGLGAKHSRSIV